MLSIQLNKSSKIPLYEQLYFHIKREITTGRMPFGNKLPSKRKLEQFLNLSQTTIETAYEQLVAEGYVESRPRRGYYVLAKEELAYHSATFSEKVLLRQETPEQNLYQFDFFPGIIDNSMFPFKKWRSLYCEAISEQNKALLLLGSSIGELSLRQEIATYLYHSRGVVCSPDQIIVGAGIEQLFPQLIYLLGEKAVYGIENPGYQLVRHVLNSHKKKFFLISVDAEGADVQRLAKSEINTMYVTPSHQFPYGSILSVNRRTQLLNWSHQKTDRYIIEDDYDSEFKYSGRTTPSLHSLGKGETVIYLSTFSKSLMPSLRIGYMVLPPVLMSRYQNEFSHYASCVSRIDQYVLARFMMEGFFEKHLNRMRTVYRKKLEIVVNMLQKYQEKIAISGEKAGLHLLLTFPKNKSEHKLIETARIASIRVCGLSTFFHEDYITTNPGIVLGFGVMSNEKLYVGLKKLINCWF